MGSRAAIAVSVVTGLIALVIMSTYIGNRESALLELAELQDVYVAAADILPNTIIDESLIQRVQVPSIYLQPSALSSPAAIVGRVAAVPIPRGAQILGGSLENQGQIPLSLEVPRGRRAVTIAVSDVTGVGGLVRPGNFVDVLGTFEFGRPTGYEQGQIQYADERTETRTLLQNVLVLAVNRIHRGAGPPARAADAEVSDEGGGAYVVTADTNLQNATLLVDPAQVQELILAQQIGDLTLALRSDLDTGEVADLENLDPLGLLGVDIPVKPKGRRPWQEIRGLTSVPRF